MKAPGKVDDNEGNNIFNECEIVHSARLAVYGTLPLLTAMNPDEDGLIFHRHAFSRSCEDGQIETIFATFTGVVLLNSGILLEKLADKEKGRRTEMFKLTLVAYGRLSYSIVCLCTEDTDG